jgi:hypothetical protein
MDVYQQMARKINAKSPSANKTITTRYERLRIRLRTDISDIEVQDFLNELYTVLGEGTGYEVINLREQVRTTEETGALLSLVFNAGTSLSDNVW